MDLNSYGTRNFVYLAPYLNPPDLVGGIVEAAELSFGFVRSVWLN
jgi:hypothetical protein